MLIANNRSLDKAVWLSFNSDALAPLWCGVYFGRGDCLLVVFLGGWGRGGGLGVVAFIWRRGFLITKS